MQQGDYPLPPYYQYHHLQNPNPLPPNTNPPPVDQHPIPYASAPPFATSYSPADYSGYPPNYSSYPHNPDSVPVSPTPPSNPNLQTPFNQTPQLPSSFSSFESQGAYQPPAPQQSYYPPFDQHQSATQNYAPPTSSIAANPNHTPSPNSNQGYSSLYSSPYGQVGSSVPQVYENSYEATTKYDLAGGYVDEGFGNYGRSRSDMGADLYGKRPDFGRSQHDRHGDDGYGSNVYAYEGGKVEPYGARGTAPKSSTWSQPQFDDYGRAITFPSGKDSSLGSAKIVKAVPKVENQQDVKSGVQKFRVKLLAESGGQSTMDVLCQIGLDGIQMLDPNTSRTLRIYPLENITRCEVIDASTFAFWSKSPVDFEPRRIRLQSNRYTTNTLLDTVTAATVQLKEMGGRSKSSDSLKTTEQPVEKRKGLGDWMNKIKPANEEKDHWVPDEVVTKCTSCGTDFGAFVRKHHCRNCGEIFCDKCTHGRITLTAEENAPLVRVCDRCMAEVTQRLSTAKEGASKPLALQNHEDLARKLQEEMERNRKGSSGSKSDGSGKMMKEVACPTCTVHLQVQVPSSGSQTIECGVCQHPFLVSAQ